MSILNRRGFTLIELMITVMIISILVGVAVPLARNSIKRQKEIELREDLRLMRAAIDKYKDLSDRGFIMLKVDTEGYPETLQVLVDGRERTRPALDLALERVPLLVAEPDGIRVDLVQRGEHARRTEGPLRDVGEHVVRDRREDGLVAHAGDDVHGDTLWRNGCANFRLKRGAKQMEA